MVDSASAVAQLQSAQLGEEMTHMGRADATSLSSSSSWVSRAAGRIGTVSTPSVLWLSMVAVVIGSLVLGAVALQAATERQKAVEAVITEGAPLVARAEDLYVALADADAAATTAFLSAGLEPTPLRDRYDSAIARAGENVVAVSASPALAPTSRQAVARIAAQLPVYTGWIESARANSRLGHAVGAAYQRDASEVMRYELLPAAGQIYESAARELDSNYRSGSERHLLVAVIVVTAVVLCLLALTQVYVGRRTKRFVNLGLAGASVLVVGVGAWLVVGLEDQHDSLMRSRRAGSDPLLVLSTTRILALRSLSDENLDLIERGTDDSHRADFSEVTASIGDAESTSGLLGFASRIAVDDETRSRVAAVSALYESYLGVHSRVRERSDAYDYRVATDVAVGELADAAAALDDALEAEIERSRQSLDAFAHDASDRLQPIPIAVLVLTMTGALAVVAGLWPRIREYR